MLKDAQNRHNLGFGISPSSTPIATNYRGADPYQSTFDPNSGHLAKALYGHPVARFLTTIGATALAIGIASRLKTGAAVKLSSFFDESNAGVGTWRTTLAHGWRDAQDTLDTWEGVGRLRNEQGLTKGTFKKAGFFISQADKERAAEATARGLNSETVSEWAFRDEIQQRLVHRARALPYEMPAIFAAGKIANRLTGQPDENIDRRHKTKWYNPVDVMGDFAEFSVRNVISQLAPWEVGTGAATQGWRRLMTYGDIVSDTQPFNHHIHLVSVGLKSSLEALGQSSSKLIYETTKRSSQVAGSFGTAIGEALKERQPSGLLYSAKVRRSWESHKATGQRAALAQLFPGTTRFGQSLKKEWFAIEDANRNAEALDSGAEEYIHPVTKQSVPVNKLRHDYGHAYDSDIEQFAHAITGLEPQLDIFGNIVAGSNFAKKRTSDAYLNDLTQNLIRHGPPSHTVEAPEYANSVRNFTNHVNIIMGFPSRDRPDLRANMIRRINFGVDAIKDLHDVGGPTWEEQLQERMAALKLPTSHINMMTRNLQAAVHETDIPFQTPELRGQLNAQIVKDWHSLYHQTVIPGIKARTREVRIPSERVRPDISTVRDEALTRKLATSYGLEIEGVSTSVLRGQMRHAGIDLSDFYAKSGQLHEQKLIARPWQKGGFNIFGLRPLTISEGLQKNFFPEKIRPRVEQLNQDLSDRWQQGNSGLQAGRGLYMTSAGHVLDLRRFYGSARTLSDLAAQHFQIPILGFSPYDLTAYQARRMMRMKPLLQVESGKSRQFVQGDFDSYVWIGGKRRGVGKLYGNKDGETTAFAGRYRPGLTGGESLIARQTRLAFGETGFYRPPADPNTRMGRLKNWLNLNPVQQDSIVDVGSRLRRSSLANKFRRALHPDQTFEDDLNSPPLFWRRFLDLVDKGTAITPADVKGFNEATKDLRYHYALTPGLMQSIQRFARSYEAGPEENDISYLGDLFDVHDPLAGPNSKIALSSIRRPAQMYRSIGALLDADHGNLDHLLNTTPLNSAARSQLRSTRNFVARAYLDQESISGALEAFSPRMIKSTGIFRRIDEFRNDVYQYIISREIITHQGDTDIVVDLLSTLDKMKYKQLIGGHDYTEARAAILGAQVRASGVMGYQTDLTPSRTLRNLMGAVGGRRMAPQLRKTIEDLGQYHGKMFGHHDILGLKRRILSAIGAGAEKKDYIKYNIYRGGQQNVYIPTSGTVFARNPLKFAQSALGYNTWNNPQGFSLGSVPVGHLVERLNRYFSFLNLGVNPAAYKGPLSMYTFGMVGKRILPAVVVGSIFNTADRTLGGFVYGKAPNGKRQYKPLVGGLAASTFAHLDIALTPGHDRREQKREEYFGDQDVPVRRGRYWAFGSTPWRGGRIMYNRPNWYRRYMSGYQYTGQAWKSPTQKLLYGEDFSPLRPLDPYKFERMHYRDRPYPETGQYFSGPWGPLTQFLNLTAGHALKPTIHMHPAAMAHGMSMYQAMGYNGMVYNPDLHRGGQMPLVVGRSQTGSPQVFGTAMAGQILGMQESALVVPPTGTWRSPYRQPWGFMGMPYGTSPYDAIQSYSSARGGTGAGNGTVSTSGPITQAAAGNNISNAMLATVNQSYAAMAGTPAGKRAMANYSGPIPIPYTAHQQATLQYGNNPYNRVVMTPNRSFDPRVVLATDPLSYNDRKVQSGQFLYGSQEMAGIYGFAFGNAKAALGLGSANASPRQAVYQTADRAYGSERSFWDLNLGGLGDFPVYGSTEFGNIEMSEIIRRFIPHRRRDINEINPIPNQMGQQYPWLPGSDYFINYKIGDPYIARDQMPGEMMLPGAGYETLHPLHPDFTGKYGLLDQQRVLGNVAPWSNEYKAVNQVLQKSNLSPLDRAYFQQTKKMVSSIKQKQPFYPYKYANNKFTTEDATVTGFVPGEADMLITDKGIVKFAGVRARANKDAMDWLQNSIKPPQHIKITFDANYPPKRDQPLEAIVEANGENLNQQLLANPDIAYPSRKQSPLDTRMRQGTLDFGIHSLMEKLAHQNTWPNNKFYPRRTAIEDWERNYVYGSSFPQWGTPYSSFIKPLTYRAMNRNPIEASVVLGLTGRLFMRSPEGKTVGGIVGATTGAGLALFSNTKTYETGQRFLPRSYKEQGQLDEYIDMLNYIKYTRLYAGERRQAQIDEGVDPETIAREIENGKYKSQQFTNIGRETAAALQYRQQMRSTMYGADIYGDVMNLSAAIPKQQRAHFLEFLSAPQNERGRILSVMPRMERRIFEARWGMQVEQRPNLVDYFSQHELPPPQWSGWCLPAEAQILRDNFTYVNASDIAPKDKLYSINNEGEVLNIYKRHVENETIYQFKTCNDLFQIESTGNHLILVGDLSPCRRPKRRYPSRVDSNLKCIPTNSKLCNDCKLTTTSKLYLRDKWTADWNLKWINASQITDQDYLALPRIQFLETYDLWENSIIITDELAYLFGLFLAEGHIIWNSKSNNPERGIGFTFNMQTEQWLAEKCQNIIQKSLNCNAQKHNRIKSDGTSVEVISKYRELGILFYKYFGRYSDGKDIHPDILKMSISNICAMLDGLFEGDADERDKLCTTSKGLAQKVWILLNSLGIPASITTYQPKDRKRKWYVNVLGDFTLVRKRMNNVIEENQSTIAGGILIRGEWFLNKITSATTYQYNGELYDFTIAPNAAFCSFGGTYHNSPGLDLDDVKIKMAQHEGLNLSNMGYYPQQLSEANALNLPYPEINQTQSPHQSAASLRAMMSANNLSGAVQVIPTNQPGSTVELHMGVNS